jgi:hypothetical protein
MTPADPVRGLMHRHEELCARAVDPLEIAAALEAQGMTDRIAGRFRHRDVFSLAEEMFVRVPRAEEPASRTALEPLERAPRRWIVLHALPGLLCAAATLAASTLAPGVVVTAVAVPLIAVAVIAALRCGPLRADGDAWLWLCGLSGFVLYGRAAETPAVTAPTAVALALAFTFAIGPAAWCARRFGVRARARLAAGRGLNDFAADVRPLLAGVLSLFALALAALLCGTFALEGLDLRPSALAGPAALGMLLFTARLLAVHGFPATAVGWTGAACALEALALVTPVPVPAPTLMAVTAVPALACAAHAFRLLSRACGHAPAPADPW